MRINKKRITFIIIMMTLTLSLLNIQKSVFAAGTDNLEKHKISRIVIDPGHGGKDPGATGPCGATEKEITLAVSKELAARLRDDAYEIFLTRKSDTFVPLEERTAFANKKKADLFISVHVNANDRVSLRGVETYFLNLTTDASAIKVADRENAVASKTMGDLQFIIKDLMLNARINESSRFASSIQKSIISSLGRAGHANKDHGVKQAPFYVLMGAQMPSILIETGFITNAMESKLLQRKSYQHSIVQGIISGINLYVTNTSVAYSNRNVSRVKDLN
jgi:N-acetylmuramoyl-L-alanine amidase